MWQFLFYFTSYTLDTEPRQKTNKKKMLRTMWRDKPKRPIAQFICVCVYNVCVCVCVCVCASLCVHEWCDLECHPFTAVSLSSIMTELLNGSHIFSKLCSVTDTVVHRCVCVYIQNAIHQVWYHSDEAVIFLNSKCFGQKWPKSTRGLNCINPAKGYVYGVFVLSVFWTDFIRLLQLLVSV